MKKTAFYCANCAKEVATKRADPVKYLYECAECGWRHIIIGTSEGIEEYFAKKHR